MTSGWLWETFPGDDRDVSCLQEYDAYSTAILHRPGNPVCQRRIQLYLELEAAEWKATLRDLSGIYTSVLF
jgi:hypothetical protein